MKRQIVPVVIASISTVGALLSSAVPAAAATTGGSLWNDWHSPTYVYVYNTSYPTQDSPVAQVLSPRQGSTVNVTGIRLRYGCRGKSQYSGSAWPYAGTVVYRYTQSNLHINLTIACPPVSDPLWGMAKQSVNTVS